METANTSKPTTDILQKKELQLSKSFIDFEISLFELKKQRHVQADRLRVHAIDASKKEVGKINKSILEINKQQESQYTLVSFITNLVNTSKKYYLKSLARPLQSKQNKLRKASWKSNNGLGKDSKKELIERHFNSLITEYKLGLKNITTSITQNNNELPNLEKILPVAKSRILDCTHKIPSTKNKIETSKKKLQEALDKENKKLVKLKAEKGKLDKFYNQALLDKDNTLPFVEKSVERLKQELKEDNDRLTELHAEASALTSKIEKIEKFKLKLDEKLKKADEELINLHKEASKPLLKINKIEEFRKKSAIKLQNAGAKLTKLQNILAKTKEAEDSKRRLEEKFEEENKKLVKLQSISYRIMDIFYIIPNKIKNFINDWKIHSNSLAIEACDNKIKLLEIGLKNHSETLETLETLQEKGNALTEDYKGYIDTIKQNMYQKPPTREDYVPSTREGDDPKARNYDSEEADTGSVDSVDIESQIEKKSILPKDPNELSMEPSNQCNIL